MSVNQSTGEDPGRFQMDGVNISDQVNDLKARLSAVITEVENHPKMDRGNPIATHPKSLFWVWDFLMRTLHNLSKVDLAKIEGNESEALKAWQDVLGRVRISHLMITDDSGQFMRIMTAGGQAVDFGPEAKSKAKALQPIAIPE